MREIRSGVTLIEVVMAIVISSIVVYALLSVFMNAAFNNVRQEAVSIGVHLAEGKLETVSSKVFSSINSESLAAFGGAFNDFNSQVEVHFVSAEALDVSVDPLPTGYKKVTVRVSGSNLAAPIEAATLVTDVSNAQ